MRKPDKSGSGLIKVGFDEENIKFQIDFSGIEKVEVIDSVTQEKETRTYNYFNSESVLFFVANSYWVANRAIKKDLLNDIELYKKQKDRNLYKKILRHILPYYFNFRHFVEVEFKALSVVTKRISVKISHDLNDLYADVLEGFNNLSINSKDVFEKNESEFTNRINKIKAEMQLLKDELDKYSAMEPSVEYYRFIFDKEFNCSSPIIEFDFQYVETIFLSIVTHFRNIHEEMRKFIYYHSLI